MTNRAPLIVAIVLLLLPVLYVGSYLALVRPVQLQHGWLYQYPRIGTDNGQRVFRPLEQIYESVRPAKWVYDRIDEREWEN
jgi:hypothetical protein